MQGFSPYPRHIILAQPKKNFKAAFVVYMVGQVGALEADTGVGMLHPARQLFQYLIGYFGLVEDSSRHRE
jgi:hypothetical protein